MARNTVYSSTFKAQVVQEILREEKPLTQIASDHGIHPKVLRAWKAIALQELPTLFERQSSVAKMTADHERQVEDLYAEIGRLTTQVTWLKKKLGA
jgi:transposase-like protein